MTESASNPNEALEEVERETGVGYDFEERMATYPEAKNDTETFVGFVNHLFEKSYIGENNLPYTPGYGKIRYLLNTSPTHQDGRDMTRPEEVADNIFLETNHDSSSKKRYTGRLIEDFVLD